MTYFELDMINGGKALHSHPQKERLDWLKAAYHRGCDTTGLDIIARHSKLSLRNLQQWYQFRHSHADNSVVF